MDSTIVDSAVDAVPPALNRAGSSVGKPMGLQKWREMRSAILVEKRQEAGWDNFFKVAKANAGGKGQRGWLDFLTSRVKRASSRKVHPAQADVDSSFSSHSSIGRRAEASMKKQKSSGSFGSISAKIKRQVSRSIFHMAGAASASAASPSPTAPVSHQPDEEGSVVPADAPTAVAAPVAAPGSAPDEADPDQSEFERRRKVLISNDHTSESGWRGSKHKGMYKEGIFEDQKSKQKREHIRLLPEVQKIVDEMWALLMPERARVQLPGYLDFHRSIYNYIAAKETPPVAAEETDLLDAFDSGIADWRSDTEDALALVHKRELHFHLFRDSIFELIDLYTPTTDAKQYIGYMRVLFDSISKGGRLRAPWPKPHKRAEAAALLKALRADLAGSTEGDWDALDNDEQTARVAAWFRKALDAQVAADEHAAATELTLAGFLATVDRFLPDDLREGRREGHVAELHLIDIFRRFDVDATGLVSLDDLTTVLTATNAPSAWFPHKRRSSFGLKSKAVIKAVRLSKLASGSMDADGPSEGVAAPTAAPGGGGKKTSSAKKLRNVGKVTMMAARQKSQTKS